MRVFSTMTALDHGAIPPPSSDGQGLHSAPGIAQFPDAVL